MSYEVSQKISTKNLPIFLKLKIKLKYKQKQILMPKIKKIQTNVVRPATIML